MDQQKDPYDKRFDETDAEYKEKKRKQAFDADYELKDLIISVRIDPILYATAAKFMDLEGFKPRFKSDPIKLLLENYIELLIKEDYVSPVFNQEEAFRILSKLNLISQGSRNHDILKKNMKKESLSLNADEGGVDMDAIVAQQMEQMKQEKKERRNKGRRERYEERKQEEEKDDIAGAAPPPGMFPSEKDDDNN